GRSTLTPSVRSGAVTMKITSSTSITSMYGTTLISLIWRLTRRLDGTYTRLSPGAGRGRRRLAVDDAQELLEEYLVAADELLGGVAETVVGDDRRNGREQAHGGGDQRLGDTGR